MHQKARGKAYRDQQRARLARLGVEGRQLIEQLVTDLIRCGYRPREAWRLAYELTQNEAAARFNQIKGDPASGMRGSRICEYEKWPIGGSRPSVRTLKTLAAVYETTWDRLVDINDLENMPTSDRQAFLDISDLHYGDSLYLPVSRRHPGAPHSGDNERIHRPVSAKESVAIAERARCTLPVDTVAFTGRNTEVQEIIASVTAAAKTGRVVAIHAIDGMPGVGKTALAVHVGHLMADLFPDRQLFLDLHAHTAGQQSMAPEKALAHLLTADGVNVRALPQGLDERAALWRDRTAHKRVLLVLDNAASSGQVIPLLPGSPGCLVLVTSRCYLGDLPSAVPVPLGILPAEEARQMFLRLAPRAAVEPARVAEVVALCGHLPLAISLLASLFSNRRSWTLGQLIDETRATLVTVAAENRTVAAAFDLSYQCLPAERQLFFRQLSLHPGVDIDAYAAAALTGLTRDQAGENLDVLCRDHLLDEPVYRRYRMHDLIRDYARALAATDPVAEQDQALGRLLDYYQHTAALADARLTRLTRPSVAASAMPPVAIPGLADRDKALAWLRIERANLRACLDHAMRHAHPDRVVGLTAGLASLLRSDGPWIQAQELHTQAATVARQFGDRLGEANALTDLGVVRWVTGDCLGAAQVLEQALRLYRDINNRNGEANALTYLGVVRWVTGNYPGAARVLEQALHLCRETDNRNGEAHALTYLGIIQRVTGNYPGAAQMLKQALHLHRELDNRIGEANTLTYLGGVWRLTGDYPDAIQVLEQALHLHRELDNRIGEANALTELGGIRRRTEDHPGAIQMLEQALRLHRELSNRIGEANTLTELGATRLMTGDYPGAIQLLEQALRFYHDVGNRHAEAEVLNHHGTVSLKSGDSERALAHHQRALDLAHAMANSLEQARALDGAGRCALAQGDTATAMTDLRQALKIYQRIGAAEATQLATDLDLRNFDI